MAITSADAGRMYPVWKWLGITEEEFVTRFYATARPQRTGFWRCLKDGCTQETATTSFSLCLAHLGAYHRKRAQVIRSMGA